MNNKTIKYQKINYNIYQERINSLLNDNELKKLGIKKNILNITNYNYPLELISIGYGKKELFIIGTTHGSEIISTDFITQLIKNIPNIDFDPNIFTLKIIPLQNPEGFEISTSTFSNINKEIFNKEAYNYYKNYKIDNLVAIAENEINTFLNSTITNPNIITSDNYLKEIKYFIKNNNNWKYISNNLNKINILNNNILNIKEISNIKILKQELLISCYNTLKTINKEQNIGEIILINQIINSLTTEKIWKKIDTSLKKKLHQQMFKNNYPTNIKSKKLQEDIQKIEIPKGSYIIWDATGPKTNINLNANVKTNPGINYIKQNITIYGKNAKNNIKNYHKGPIGLPTEDINNFKYAKENIELYKLLKESYFQKKYLATLLYHSSGGVIYYKPYEPLIEPNKYKEYLEYNLELATIYKNETNYKILETSDNTGYGDKLRRTFPRVLLIELSKMGGNPLGPYGDKNNIIDTIEKNINAIEKILNHYSKTKNKVI